MITFLVTETLNFESENQFTFPFVILWAIIPCIIIGILNTKFWHSVAVGVILIFAGGITGGIGLGLFAISGYTISDTQVKSFITWAEEDALLTVNHDQAVLILRNKTDEDGYRNRNDKNQNDPSFLTEVKDVYGNTVDVLLVKLDDGEWTIKQFSETTVSVSLERAKK